MANEVLIKRYNTYYQGWCLSFGEHEADTDEDRDLYWLIGEARIGMAVSPKLKRTLNLALLGHHEKTPELVLENDTLKAQDTVIYKLTDEVDKEGMGQLKIFLDGKDDLHLFITSHFGYPSGTCILTFSREKPTILLYKEMQPLKVMIK